MSSHRLHDGGSLGSQGCVDIIALLLRVLVDHTVQEVDQGMLVEFGLSFNGLEGQDVGSIQGHCWVEMGQERSLRNIIKVQKALAIFDKSPIT